MEGGKREIKYAKKWNNNGMSRKNKMSQLCHKQTQNSTIIITTVTVSLRYSLNGGELLWYFKKRYWQLCCHGSPKKSIDKLVIVNRKIGIQCSNYNKINKFLKLTI
jgi:hypothetical protein